MGMDFWSPGERVARFSEYVDVVDGLLGNPSRAYTFEGRFYRTREAGYGAPSSGRDRRSPSAVSHRPSCGSLPSGLIAGTPPGRLA
jgi:alkanesulfonate monooxygenase SsuD/methylene tetrahydromethanopterin reductase-like flavin-dependent oxidoreductase (luciferase family)